MKKWVVGGVAANFIAIILICGLCYASYTLIAFLGRDCDLTTWWYDAIIRTEPQLPLPENTEVIQTETDGGSAYTGIYFTAITTADYDDVAKFYMELGAICTKRLPGDNFTKFDSYLQEPRWYCSDIPGNPYELGNAIIYSKRDYASAVEKMELDELQVLKDIFTQTEMGRNGLTVIDGDIGHCKP